MSHGEV